MDLTEQAMRPQTTTWTSGPIVVSLMESARQEKPVRGVEPKATIDLGLSLVQLPLPDRTPPPVQLDHISRRTLVRSIVPITPGVADAVLTSVAEFSATAR